MQFIDRKMGNRHQSITIVFVQWVTHFKSIHEPTMQPNVKNEGFDNEMYRWFN